jgi:membrane fusion protein, copper/silver efflux system
MKRLAYIFGLVAVIVVSYVAGSWNSRRVSGENTNQSAGLRYYHCPMHPSYKSDKPGDAPCCGMKLVPVYAGQESANAGASEADGAVRVSADKQQLIGVHTSVVESSKGSRTLRLLGRIASDETRIYRIKAPADGVIRDVHAGTVGSFIKKNEPLFSYYAPDIYQAQQSYFLALNGDRLRSNVQMQVTQSRLQLLGMGVPEIENLKEKQQFIEKIAVKSPISGVIIAREVSPDLVFSKGEELYRIVDLSSVWILADVFEQEAQYLRPGVFAKITYPQAELQFNARVSDVLPQFDPATRTLKVRLEAANSHLNLRPGMFVDVELPIRLPSTLAVPADAVVNSGFKKVVYVERTAGVYEPRMVKTGWRIGESVQITKGLEMGERIVTSGTFLIDSESRMNSAPAQMASHSGEAKVVKDLVCGMDVSPESSATLKSQYKGETYYFCSEMCKNNFEAGPKKYMHKPTGALDVSMIPMAK